MVARHPQGLGDRLARFHFLEALLRYILKLRIRAVLLLKTQRYIRVLLDLNVLNILLDEVILWKIIAVDRDVTVEIVCVLYHIIKNVGTVKLDMRFKIAQLHLHIAPLPNNLFMFI